MSDVDWREREGGKRESYNSMKLAAFVTLRSTELILGFSGTVLTEVFGGLGNYIGEEFELDAAERFTWMMLEIGLLGTKSLGTPWRIG